MVIFHSYVSLPEGKYNHAYQQIYQRGASFHRDPMSLLFRGTGSGWAKPAVSQ